MTPFYLKKLLGAIKLVLLGFEIASGLHVNFYKSKIIDFNVYFDFL